RSDEDGEAAILHDQVEIADDLDVAVAFADVLELNTSHGRSPLGSRRASFFAAAGNAVAGSELLLEEKENCEGDECSHDGGDGLLIQVGIVGARDPRQKHSERDVA